METKQVSIEVGRKVYTNLYNRGTGVIYEVIGEPAPQTVRQIGGIMSTGGRCEVNIAFEYGGRSLRLPECILMGVQWKLLDDVASPEQVAAVLGKALTYEALQKARADEVVAAFKVAQAAALEAGKKLGLIPEAEFNKSGKRGSAAASNLRAELKAAGFKCGVKQDGYSCINITAPAGADMERVKAICSKYKAGSFDGMSDCYDYDPSAWGSVFGDVQYVFVRGE
jgi:Large polyvalent protein associated domain 30